MPLKVPYCVISEPYGHKMVQLKAHEQQRAGLITKAGKSGLSEDCDVQNVVVVYGRVHRESPVLK